MKLTPENKIALGFAVAFVVLIGNGLVSYRAASRLAENDRLVLHTHEVLVELEATLSTLKDAETGQRGYLITGEDGYLSPYKIALIEIEEHLSRLKTLTQDNPDQQRRLTLLEGAARDKLRELDQSVSLRRQSGFDAARALVLTNVGKNAMDECRNVAGEMERTEYEELSIQGRKATASIRATVLTFWFATLLAVAFLGIVYLVTARSFAERKQSEEKIREHREWLKVTLASIGDAVMASDTEGNISFMNGVAESLTGWSQEEAAGKPMAAVFQIVNEHTRQEVPSPATRVLAEGVTVGLANHTVLIDKNGGETPIDDSGAPIKDADGKLLGVVLVFRDVSERRRADHEREELLAREQAARREADQARQLTAELLEREREARSEAEAASRTKDEFLATVSHELRTPLNAVLGWARMLGAGALDGASSARAIETIQRNARSQAQLIDDLLDVSRIITGKLRLEMQPVEMAEIIQAAVDSIRPAAEAKGIHLEIMLKTEAGFVSGDPDRLQQIIWNLVSNAVKFTPKGGRVEIRLERVGSQVGIIVNDNGRGITAELLPYVFDRFRQGDASLTRTHAGLGLGLAIVRHLVELHGGTATVSSPGDGGGSTFTVLLPMLVVHEGGRSAKSGLEHQRSSGTSGMAADQPPRLDGLNLLIVDDERDARDMLTIMLSQCGAQVTAAATAAQALEAVERHRPDLLVSDIEMPEVDGYGLIAKVRAIPGKRGLVPAVALTAHARMADRLRALQAGFDAHVAKPVEFVELVTVLASLARRSLDGHKS
jgi:PAS domain S-box-containing protein